MDGFTFPLLFTAGWETNNNQYTNKVKRQLQKLQNLLVEMKEHMSQFRDILESVFTKYDDAASRLKATEALKTWLQRQGSSGNKVTFEYTANMSKFIGAWR